MSPLSTPSLFLIDPLTRSGVHVGGRGDERMRSRGSDFRKWEEAEASQLKSIVLIVRSPPISSLKNSDLARSGQLVSLLAGCRPIKSVSQACCCPRQHTCFGPASFISSPRCVRRRNQEDEEENSDHVHVCMYFLLMTSKTNYVPCKVNTTDWFSKPFLA